MPRIAMSATYPLAANVAAIYGASSPTVGVSNTSLLPNPSGSTAYWRPNIALCKGAVPVAHPANYTDRSADFLVWYADPGNTPGTMFSSTTNVNDLTTINTQPVAAGASGLATWFWLWSGTTPGYSATVNQSTIGTVGMPGSGADLIIPDTNIVVGLQYRVIFPIRWPSAWNF